MQIDTQSMEKMAREYNQVLSNYDISDSSAGLLEKIIILSENQLDIINYMLCCPQSKQCKKSLNYLKTLITTAIIALHKLLDQGDYLPSFRNSDNMYNYQNSYIKLTSLQLDIFILLDKLALVRNDIINIQMLENRIMSIIAIVCR